LNRSIDNDLFDRIEEIEHMLYSINIKLDALENTPFLNNEEVVANIGNLRNREQNLKVRFCCVLNLAF
jgi:hypothetical protein